MKRTTILFFIALALCSSMVACTKQPQGTLIEWSINSNYTDKKTANSFLVERYPFSTEQIEAFLSKLYKNGYTLAHNYYRSKKEWEFILDGLRNNIAPHMYSEQLLMQIEDAISKASADPRFIETSFDNPNDGNNVFTIIPYNNASLGQLIYQQSDNSFYFYRSDILNVIDASMYEYNKQNENDLSSEFLDWLSPSPTVSSEECLKYIYPILDGFNFELDLFHCEPCAIIENYVNRTDGWLFVFTRCMDELQSQYWNGQWCSIEPSYLPISVAPWEQEVCYIIIDDKGICEFCWTGASITNNSSETMTLLDFSEIKRNATTVLNNLYKDCSYRDGIWVDILIKKVELGIALISYTENMQKGQYVPAYYITYAIKWSDAEDIPDNWEEEQLIINAITGAYIEPRVTLEDINSFR